MLGVESLAQAFERHAHRRSARTPTPVALVGVDVVAEWQAAQGREVVCSIASAIDGVVVSYLAHPFVASRLARRLGERRGTDYERTVATAVVSDAMLAAGDADGHVLVHRDAAPARVFAAAVRVLCEEAPSLLLDSELDSAIRIAIALAEAAPALPIAVATSAPSWARWSAMPGREHARAIIEACTIDEPPAPATKEEDDAARSAAERLLFDALEAHPKSRGRFALNRSLEVLFGSRALEIDLACTSPCLAIEVDGYYHFKDAEAYRRDRRKDLALQRAGYFVHRVLAEDVMANVADVVTSIHASLEFLVKT
jgi:very-short-patch-repair endonuclease